MLKDRHGETVYGNNFLVRASVLAPIVRDCCGDKGRGAQEEAAEAQGPGDKRRVPYNLAILFVVRTKTMEAPAYDRDNYRQNGTRFVAEKKRVARTPTAPSRNRERSLIAHRGSSGP